VAREHHDIDGIARATDDVDEIERRIYSRRIGAIASDLARVSRERILDNAMRLLDYHASTRHLLEVQFVGEDGFGSGVTQNFYEAVSGTLQKRTLNKDTPLWITDGHDAEHAADPEGQYAYLTNAEGLFPQPLSQSSPKLAGVCDMYRFMGTLMAKACRDKFTVPLPLHPHFFVVLKVAHAVIYTYFHAYFCTYIHTHDRAQGGTHTQACTHIFVILCMCVCTCVWTCVCMHVHVIVVLKLAYMDINIFSCFYECMYVCMCLCMYARACLKVTLTDMNKYFHVFVCVYVCLYMIVYVCTHCRCCCTRIFLVVKMTYTYINTYFHSSVCVFLRVCVCAYVYSAAALLLTRNILSTQFWRVIII
jgi:hypothetical protein